MAIENLITNHLDLWTAAVRPKSSAGRGSNSKLELTGIKKLRELILELAVRGKLVPQDPSDEPASVLLERIAAEKARLVKEGKIKKPKALPEIGKEDKPFELPAGWEWSMLAEIAAINPRNEIDDAADASFVPMSLISTSYNGQHEFEARKWGEIKKGFTHFANGDIGIAKITPCFENSKAAVFRGLINGVGAGTTELHIARPYTDYVSALFILLNIKSPIYLKKGEAGMTGTAGQKRLAKDFFSFYPLPIPPLAEQKRIVAKVDELMALCDQLELRSESQLVAHQTLVEALLATLTDSSDTEELAQNWARLNTHFDTLFTTEASIDALKQTILQLAAMGKLVQQDPCDEPATALLERIAAEKARLVKEGKIKKPKALPEIGKEDKPFELPAGWEWSMLAEIAAINPRNEIDDAADASFVPMSLISTSYNGQHEFEARKWGEIKKGFTHFANGDIGIAKITPCFENSKAAVFRGLINGVGAGTTELHIARPYTDYVSALFILLNIKSPIYLKKGEAGMTGTAGQKRLAKDFFSFYPLPIPPLAEQKRIVAKVDELMTLCDQLKSRLQTSQQTQFALAESLAEGALEDSI
ncbi:restriction endonuclease subunit S [Aeromonas hydrophila]|uniref:restriction endonuclease subunit S n=1 Tax=Aeromonas hydrophila TaxID=644 RepID=UPI001A8C9D35|nr:restriction endonuclease subunit S [Aeromonas hydrophila]MBQ4667476.1 restriction endonuclease subunit S [Aeromonas hydrophila]MBQ4714161.1 restriction endonuclease subunit S [Aeromonas hydrophila]MBW3822577.1 restriction endonuclease subunit S [Aeromonas hydrophila]MBW5269191.1 restriction endonuclease subunit S [Aeromonas hydrophila]QSR52494.1 restriction endonuclease subunit S [Aeromonas hydrophila]